MERQKNALEAAAATPVPAGKSWVASRYTVLEEGGKAIRRCKFLNCTKEYARGTSHMILKRHWSRAHGDQFSEVKSSSTRLPHKADKNLTENPNYKATNKKSANQIKAGGSVKKKGGQDYGCHSLNNNSFNYTDKNQLDVKMVSKRLREATSIHLTFDIYTAKKGAKSYGIITAHSLGDTYEIRSVILDYRHLPYPDDSNTIYESLRACIAKFNIKEKIVGMSSSCSEPIESAVQELDKRFRLSKNFNFSNFHIKCFPQFVHLNVIEILKSQEALIENVRKVIGFINNSNFTLRPVSGNNTDPSAESVIATNTNSVDNNGAMIALDPGAKATGLKLPYDNRSSWNSTYTMIETFIQQREFIGPALLYFPDPQGLGNANIDWDRLFTLNQLLKPFYDVVNKFSMDNYTPLSLVAVSIPSLMDHLSSTSWGYEDLVMAAHRFKMQLESYRQLFQSDLTVIAGLLDPRVKDTFICPEGRDDAINILRKRLDAKSTNAPQVKNETNIQYQYPEGSLWSRIFRTCNYDEITDYLESPREHGYTSSFAYWEAHRHVYPNLYNLARILVCVQASSVASDRMFSAAENAERERKIQLDSTNSKEIMKSWAKYLDK